MFKRIGATIVTIVMLLSMASVFSSAESEPMKLQVEFVDAATGNPLTTAAPGDKVKAVVTIHNPVALSGMAVAGTYSTAIFAPDGDPAINGFTVGENELAVEDASSNNGRILAGWVATTDVQPEDGATLMTVPLTVKADADFGEAEISFNFVESEMLIKGTGSDPVLLDAASYSAEPASKSITIDTATPTYLEVVAPATAVVGGEITVEVWVKDYAKNWSTLSILGSYNKNVLELDETSVIKGEFKNSEVVDESIFKNQDGTITAVWVNEQIVDNVDTEFKALTLTFNVKAQGDADLSFSFIEDGIFGADDTDPITTGFSKELVEKEIVISNSTTPVGLEVEVEDPADIKVGDTVTVKVNVKDYANAWSTMTIKGTYDKDKLELIGEPVAVDFKDTISGTEAVIEDSTAGVLGVTWLNIEAVTMPNKDFTALTLTFKAKAEGDANLSFSFIPDGILDADGETVSADAFESAEKTATVAIGSAEIKTQLSVDAVEDSAKIGETVTVKVNVENYEDNWAAMTILGTYDAKKFELIEEESKFITFSDGGITDEPVVVYDDGKVAVTWLNDDAVVMADDPFTAMELTFKVMTGENTEGAFEFSFVPEGILDADGNEVPVGDFAADKASDTVSILPGDVTTTLAVTAESEEPYVGGEVTVRVNVQNYIGLWSAMTIQGRYDADKLAVKKVTPKGFQTEDIDPEIQAENGEIKVCWANAEAVETASPNFEALEIVFTIKKGGDAEFGFSFVPDGIIDAAGEKAPASWYDTTEVIETIALDASAPAAELNVSVSSERAKVGEQITYTVNVQGYQGNWLAMSVFANYDQTKLKYIGATSSITGFEHFEADAAEPGTVKAAWMHSDTVALGSTFEAMQIVFEVLDEGDPNVSFAFPENGVIVKDPVTGNEIYAPEGTVSEDAASAPVTLFIPTFLEIDGDAVAKEGEEYTVDLKLNSYSDKWSSFSAELNYDATIFAIEEIVPNSFGGITPTVDSSVAGKISVVIPQGAGNIDAEKENILLSVKFKTIGYSDDVKFNASLLEVQTFDGNAHVDMDPYEYVAAAEELSVDINKIKVPQLTMVLEKGNAMDEGEDGVLHLYLKEYNSEWCSVPVVLNFDKDLIRIKESDIVCNPLGGVDGEVLLRADEGKVVFTWLDRSNIQDDREQILLASIPFRAYREGVAEFSAEFVANSVVTPNQNGGFDVIDPLTYILKAEDQTVTIADQYENTDPMVVSIGTAGEVIKNKKEAMTVTINNLNNRVQALSVKLFYDKSEVTIDQEDIDAWQSDDVTGVAILNEDEGYVHFILMAPEKISDESSLTLMNLYYTPKVEGEISFYAEIDQAIAFDEEPMVSVWDYEERSETVYVNVKAQPSLTATADKTNAKIGDTVKVTVSVNDYLNVWSGMSINGSYNKDLLKLESVTLTDAFGAANKYSTVDEEDGTFQAFWSNATNITANKEFDAIVLTFKVIDCGNGTAEFDLAFGEILTDGTTPLIPGQDYAVNAEQVDAINIEICNHKWSNKVVHKDGTSGDASKHILTCTKGCGIVKEVACSITKTYGKATCEKPGTITYKCAVCGYSETVNNPNVPALGHKFDGTPVHKAGTKKHVYTCSRGCGTTKEENCSYKTQVVQPTCLKDGYTIFTCTACGDQYTGNVVKAAGKHGALVLHYIAPTTKTNGSIITQCDTCKEYVVPPYAGAVKKTLEAGHPFPDVQDPTMWYYDAVNFSKAFEIFGGDDLGNFNPASNITRGQLVTVLGRIMMAEAEKTMSNAEFNAFLKAQTSKVSGMKSTSGFTDLGGKYYERYAKLFAKWGIVNGYPDGTFGGDKNITREEMATLIKRFVEAYRGSTANITFGNAATFKDFSKVSGWAKSNVEWVGKVGLFQGDTEKKYNPQSNATRAEIAVVIYRMLPVLKNICVCSLNH